MNLENIDEYIIDTKDMDSAMNNYSLAVHEQYFSLKSDSPRVVYYNCFSKEPLTQQVKGLLELSNYGETILDNEVIVLFSTPLFVSRLTCTGNAFGDIKSKTIRLISGKLSEKKFVSDFTIRDRSIDYKVNDTIRGIILPNKSHFTSAQAIDFYDFFKNEDRINKVTEVHQKISAEANLLKAKATSEMNKTAAYIKNELSNYQTIKNDIEIALLERDRLKDSSSENSEILTRIQDDIKKETINLKAVDQNKIEILTSLNSLKAEIEQTKKGINKEKIEFDAIKTKNIEKVQETKELDEQLRKMKKDVNLTTLDMKGYSTESDKQLKLYFGLALSAIVFLAIIFFQMYGNAETFANFVDNTNPKVDAWDILVSRLPLITATALVVGTLSALLFYLVNHIISVNSDNMNMLKASILAEQITASLPTTDMSDEDIRDYKRNAKIELVMNVFTSKQQEIKDNSQLEEMKTILKNIKIGK